MHVFLLLHSPHLNPIENVFSVIKSKYHDERTRARSIVITMIENMNENLSLSFKKLYDHMQRNLDIAFSGEIFKYIFFN